ncbi:MAG: DUF2007 domain-containing protein [Bacteroidales bacterium]|nr:DUF2007 domain-containing protein [Bacteroidales bacterium]
MEKNWVCIFKSNTAYLAEIAKDVLIEKEIDAVVINKQDSNYHFGFYELYVERNNAVRGKYILNAIEDTST